MMQSDSILAIMPPHDTDKTDFKSTLNPEQLSAVLNTEGPLLVLAGAGTGKTKVLTSRIANILLNGTFPSQILAVTFTNKAAREMADRVGKVTAGKSSGMWLGTFHSIAARILRAHAVSVGLKQNFIIIDTSDQLRLLKQIILERDIDEKKWTAKKLAGIIGSWKDKGLMPEKVSRADTYDFGGHSTLELYKTYQARLLALNAVDFGDLLLYNLILLQNNTDILQHYQRRFKYILVDEYQDTNICQYLWLRLLAQGTQNICCVGDDDQSIYGWRGAEVGNILKFERDFKGAKVVRLERNYRSTSHILTAASKLISHNKDRLGKTLWTQDNEGEPIKLVGVWDDREEARFVADEIEVLQQNHQHNLSQIAVLVRAGFQTRSFEERFIAHSIPYKVIGGLRFYERAEIKDIIAYLRLITQSEDDLAFERIINVPKRSIGDTTVKNIRDFARANRLSMFEAARQMSKNQESNKRHSPSFIADKTIGEPSFTSGSPYNLAMKDSGDDGAPILKGKAAAAIATFITQIDKWRELSNHTTLVEFVEIVLKESGYLAMLKTEDSMEAEGRIDNLKELLRALEEFDTITEFMEHVSLVSDIDSMNQENMVNIMTMHAAKGLEFETVFLPGWEEGVFPSQRSVDESGAKGLEEERRLAYVGITRAKKRAYILYAANRRIYNQFQSSFPSRFIEELPEGSTQKVNMGNGLSFGSSSSQSNEYSENRHSTSFISDKNTEENSFSSGASYGSKGDNAPKGKFRLGMRVFHVKFGYGKIVGISGNQLDVSFEKAGLKKVVDSYVVAG